MQGDGQTRTGLGQDCSGQAREVLRGELPAGAGLHQRPDRDDQGSPGAKDCQNRREHHYSPFHPIPIGTRMSGARYRRVLLKISGEILAGDQGYGVQPSVLESLADEIAEVMKMEVELAIVIGGGNIFRGIAASATGMERASADYMGMLATILNALALQNALER